MGRLLTPSQDDQFCEWREPRLREVTVRVSCLDSDERVHHATIHLATPPDQLEQHMAVLSECLQLWGERMGHQVLTTQVDVTRSEDLLGHDELTGQPVSRPVPGPRLSLVACGRRIGRQVERSLRLLGTLLFLVPNLVTPGDQANMVVAMAHTAGLAYG